MNLQKLASYQSQPKGQVWVSYFPCLVQTPGEWMDAERLPQLQDCQAEMENIKSVGWSEMGTDYIPVLYVKHAKSVVPHLRDFMRGVNFTFVWEVKKDNCYSLAIIPSVKQQQERIVYWAWSFNSTGPSSLPVANILKTTGDQRVCFADVDTKELAGVFAFPARRLSHVGNSDPIRQHAECYIFQKN